MSFVVGQKVRVVNSPTRNFYDGAIVTVTGVKPDEYGDEDGVQVQGDDWYWLASRFEPVEETLDEYKARVSKEIQSLSSLLTPNEIDSLRKNLDLSKPTKKVRLTFEVEVPDNGQSNDGSKGLAMDRLAGTDPSEFYVEGTILN